MTRATRSKSLGGRLCHPPASKDGDGNKGKKDSTTSLRTSHCLTNLVAGNASTDTGSSLGLPGKENEKPSQESAVSAVKRLEGVVEVLTDRINCLENMIKQQNDLILDMAKTRQTRTLVEEGSQTDDTCNNGLTYAGVVASASRPYLQRRTNTTLQSFAKDDAIKGGKEIAKSNRNDVSVCSKSDVKSANDDASKPREKATSQDLPPVVLLHDSILAKVQPRRLGRSYGFKASSKRAPTIKDLPSVLSATPSHELGSAEVIAIHCGINDLKTKDPTQASKDLVNAVRFIAREHPNKKIVISKVAPSRQQELKVKTDLFDALAAAELHKEKNVSFLQHDNLMASNYLAADGLHPTPRGASVLAGNLERHIRNLLWERPRKTSRLSQRPFPRFLGPPPFSPASPWFNPFGPLQDWY